MRKVRVSMWPDREIEVDDAEYADLVSLGLVQPDKPAQRKEGTNNGSDDK